MIRDSYNFLRRQHRAIALLTFGAIVATSLAWCALFGVPDVLQDPERLAVWLDDPSWFTLAIAFVAYVVLGGLGVPPAIMQLTVAAALPFYTALGLGMAGGLGASVLGFWISRHFAQDILEPRIPPKVRRFEERLEKHAFSTVVILRLMFFLFPPVNWLLGLSHVTLRTFIAGSFIGCIPGLLLYTITGNGLIPWLITLPPTTLALLIGGATLALLAWWFLVIRRDNA